MSVIAYNIPMYPFSGFRGALFAAMRAEPGRFVAVPSAVGRGFNATTAAKKINLRFARDGLPYEVRTLGPAKAPTSAGIFIVGAIGEGRVSRDSRSGTRRTAANEGAENFGKERIAPTLIRYAEKAPVIREARDAAIEKAKADALAAALSEVFGEPIPEPAPVPAAPEKGGARRK